MLATEFIEKSRDPIAWRTHARALRRSANVLWDEFARALVNEAEVKGRSSNFAEAFEILETSKLLYGLALETALKAWIVEHVPSKIEVRVAMDGMGEAIHAELRAVGVPTSSGHNLLALAEAADLFGASFQSVLHHESDRRAVRNICRDLGEVVLWRGRYPVPLASTEPLKLDPSVPPKVVAHYMLDWLNPILDVLLDDAEKSAVEVKGAAGQKEVKVGS
ncbi:hypothetical protein [Burkholderia sp. D-99]|uniref:hypothetical protein n=1 Tax=Burkholderia sp. D-99 TaxID=2717316 RepID=UPI001423BD2B|nr:hypothetical protein [Burkholderia sp. D-99]NHV25852.1 hypothetical protein [Burkholderia sp. D-99]